MLLELKPEVVFSLCQYYREKYGRLPENDREIQFMIITLLKGRKKYIEKWLIYGWYGISMKKKQNYINFEIITMLGWYIDIKCIYSNFTYDRNRKTIYIAFSCLKILLPKFIINFLLEVSKLEISGNKKIERAKKNK